MNKENSYRTILRSSSIMGTASVITVLIGLIRTKLAAVLLGPAGIGLIGLYQTLLATASTISAVGLGSAGVRQIAEAHANGAIEDVVATRRALFWATVALATLGGLVFFLLRDFIAARVVAGTVRGSEIGWLALGVCLTVASGSQVALLNGYRRIEDLARLSIASCILSTLIAIVALVVWRESGMIAYVVCGPFISFVVGQWYVAKLGRTTRPPTPLRDLTVQWTAMAKLGSAFMITGLVAVLGQLLVRSLVQYELGSDALGQFQASWTIGMTYLTFVLGAMATDYYPRLTACIRDHRTATELVNQQTEVALLLGGPVVLLMLALAPYVIWLLYTTEFSEAANILRWQLLGDILKIMSWPLGFVLVASGAGKTFVFTETVAMGVFVTGVYVGLPLFGILATGKSFLLLYVVYLPLVFSLARRRIGFSWLPGVKRHALRLGAAAVLLMTLGHLSEIAAAAFGLPLAVLFGLHGLGQLGTKAELSGRAGKLAAASRGIMERLRIHRE